MSGRVTTGGGCALKAALLLAMCLSHAAPSAAKQRNPAARRPATPMGFPPVATADAGVQKATGPDGGAAAAGRADGSAAAAGRPDGGAATAPPPAPAPEDPEAKKWKPSVGSQVNTGKTVNMGDRVELVITVIHAPEVSVNLPSTIKLGDEFDVVGKPKHSSEKLDDGKIKEVFTIKLSPFKVGNLKIPPVPVTFSYPRKGGDGGRTAGVAQVHTEPVLLKVTSVMANEPAPKLKPNDPPVAVMEENRPTKIALLVIACILAGALLGFLIYRWIKKRRRKALPPTPPRPAHEIALKKLLDLKDSDLLQRGEFTEFYFGVSEAIREYFGNRYNFDSLEMTSTELLDSLNAISPRGLDRARVTTFLAESDLVKFAKFLPTVEEAEDILNQAFNIVEATTVVLAVEPAAEAEAAEPKETEDTAETAEAVSGESTGTPSGESTGTPPAQPPGSPPPPAQEPDRPEPHGEAPS